MLKENIEKLYEQAGREKWKYPQVFDGLKAIGVTHDETVTASHVISYFAQGEILKRGQSDPRLKKKALPGTERYH